MKFAFFTLTIAVQATASFSRDLQDLTIADIITANPNYSTLVAAASSIPGLVEALSDPTLDITLFAPNNDAFAAFDQALLEKLLTPPWEAHLDELLLYHITEGTILSTDIPPEGVTVLADSNDDLDISFANGTIVFTNAFVDKPFSTLTAPDLVATNGVVHGVSGVFLAPFLFYDMMDLAMDVPDVVGTLRELIQMAGLEDSFRNQTFTVFSPNNEAFDALDDAVVATLTDPDNVDILRQVLLYHVTSELLPAMLLTSTDYVTEEGSNITVVVNEAAGEATVNGANVIYFDVVANNGLAHVIDKVLLPPGLLVPGKTTPTMRPSGLESTMEPLATKEPAPTGDTQGSGALFTRLGGLVMAAAAFMT